MGNQWRGFSGAKHTEAGLKETGRSGAEKTTAANHKGMRGTLF